MVVYRCPTEARTELTAHERKEKKVTTFTLTDEDFWRLVSALEDDAFKALHSAKEAQTTGYYKADETAEKRIQHAHKLFDIANQLKAQARG